MNANIVKTKQGVDYQVQTTPGTVRVFNDPYNPDIHIIHAYVPIREFPNGLIPDDVNPRSHEKIPTRLAQSIEESLKESPESFHLLNRGVLVLADKASYDEQTHTLHFTLASNEINGMADGATTDRVLAKIKSQIPEFDNLRVEKMPEYMRDSVLHIEIISGDISDVLVDLAGARNTSIQVKEFALENLGGGFDWLKDAVKTDFPGRIRFRENDPEPVDIVKVLGLLTLFHPRWSQEKREPIVAYTNKAEVLDMWRDEKFKPGFFQLRSITSTILKLYDYINVNFPEMYEKYKQSIGSRARFGMRKEVKFKEKGLYTIPLTQQKSQYLIPDGWLYPILGAFRMLVSRNESPPDPLSWTIDPFNLFDNIGQHLVADVVEESDAMNHNATAVGRSRPLWNSLRKSVEMRRLNLLGQPAPTEPATEPIVEVQAEPVEVASTPVKKSTKKKKS